VTVWIGIVIAGALGAPSRYLLDGFVQDRTGGVFPWGTFVINLTGSLVLGFLSGLVLFHAFPDTPKLILGTGFCGAYTTFGTWTFETVSLVEHGELRAAALNIGASLVAGLGFAAAGLALAAI
jgi:CrcB protein